MDRLSELSEGGAWQSYRQRLAGEHSAQLAQLRVQLEAAQNGRMSDVQRSLAEMRTELETTRGVGEQHLRAVHAARMLVQ